MQVGLMGLLGAVASGTFAQFGLEWPWYVWSYIAIALVAILGYRQVDLSAKVLMWLVLAEFGIVLILLASILFTGGAEGLNLKPFTWSQITSGVPSIAFLFCFAGFIGFEATTIYSEEAKDAPVTVPKATYISVLSIGIFYTLTAWLMTMGIGVDKLLPTLTEMGDPSGFLFMLGETYVGATFTMIMGILFVAGREGILPDSLGQTHATHQSPHRGSVIQTIVAFAVVTLFLVNGLDPVLNLFVWMSQMGTLGILGLMALTSLSVLMFFMKDAMGESVLATKVLPLITGLVMGYLFIIIFRDFGALTGTEGNLGWMIPALVPLFALIGFGLASMLASRDPARFKALGNTKA
jgi:amino acid transporter